MRNEGIDTLKTTLESLYTTRRDRRSGRRRERAEGRFRALLAERLMRKVVQGALGEEKERALIDAIAERETDPYRAVESILERVEVTS